MPKRQSWISRKEMVNINISEKAIEQIKNEAKKHHWEEFGGYLVIKDNTVDEIIFDMREQSSGHVTLGFKEIIKLPEEKQQNVRGWFHKHPINGPSQKDIHTILDLTEFWGECYTLILQSNNKLLCIKTIKGKDLIFRETVIVETENEEKKIFPFNFYIPQTFPQYPNCKRYPPQNTFEEPISDYERPEEQTIDIIPEFEPENTPQTLEMKSPEEIKKIHENLETTPPQQPTQNIPEPPKKPILEFLNPNKQKDNKTKKPDKTHKNIKK